MSASYRVQNCFSQPEENHGHPGSISRVILGPGARREDRPTAVNTERLVIHTNEYEPGGDEERGRQAREVDRHERRPLLQRDRHLGLLPVTEDHERHGIADMLPAHDV